MEGSQHNIFEAQICRLSSREMEKTQQEEQARFMGSKTFA
jgi:hypothetical protein